MSALRRHLDDYLTLRRALGFKLEETARALRGFVAFADAAGASTVTTDLAVSWATLPENTSRIWIAHRLSMVRGFAGYLQTVDPAAEVPPAELLPANGYRPPPPYVYSPADVAGLMAAARALSPPLKAATFETLVGLLAVTGLRIGEAMRLDRADIDWGNQLLVVRSSKFGRTREVLCHASTIAALRAYDLRRDQLCPHPAAPSFFVSPRGCRLIHNTIYPTFHTLLAQAGVPQQPGARRPRVHDFRHSFAVNTLLGWYRDGGDVAVRMPLLSTYLGHVNPANTYWYLSAAPELMALAVDRLEASIAVVAP